MGEPPLAAQAFHLLSPPDPAFPREWPSCPGARPALQAPQAQERDLARAEPAADHEPEAEGPTGKEDEGDVGGAEVGGGGGGDRFGVE